MRITEENVHHPNTICDIFSGYDKQGWPSGAINSLSRLQRLALCETNTVT